MSVNNNVKVSSGDRIFPPKGKVHSKILLWYFKTLLLIYILKISELVWFSITQSKIQIQMCVIQPPCPCGLHMGHCRAGIWSTQMGTIKFFYQLHVDPLNTVCLHMVCMSTVIIKVISDRIQVDFYLCQA